MTTRRDAIANQHPEIRPDLLLIADMVAPHTRVLDVGCGEGVLLEYLTRVKGVDGRGVELSQAGVNAGVERGLSIIQGDADTDLNDYPSGAFDYVILSQTLQATRNPKGVLLELVRIGRRAIVSLPNFGWWRIRLKLLVDGRMPVTEALGYQWYDTPNIHLCTILDFLTLCRTLNIAVEHSLSVDAHGRVNRLASSPRLANLFGEQGLYVLSRR